MMTDKLAQAIAVYTVLEQKISEEDFRTLADIVKDQGGLGELYQEVKVAQKPIGLPGIIIRLTVNPIRPKRSRNVCYK